MRMTNMVWWLFTHADGRQRVVREDDMAFTKNEPEWVRCIQVAVVRDEASRTVVDAGRAALIRVHSRISQPAERDEAITYRAMVARSAAELEALMAGRAIHGDAA